MDRRRIGPKPTLEVVDIPKRLPFGKVRIANLSFAPVTTGLCDLRTWVNRHE